ncbi:unnamed protein product [Eruca vesicaria subsp. sativa]|uniref:Cytochrome b561 and DOMON domain-containing protein n=1 Tax=Eruca vesicaria subsp. sativa TaxID=29727 RepID=A0ABC8KKM8_ERUVS|nr:unnamed protein product [Eruca vesicaria subsp. sativa]
MKMNLYSSVSLILFTFIALQCLPFTIQQATETCISALPLNDLTFNTSLLQCLEAWTSENYILRYARTVENTWSFILSAPDSNAFIGIGFSTNGQMIGSSAVVGWLPPNGGQGQAKQYFLGGQSPSEVMPDQGDLMIVNGSLKIESVSSRLYMSFQLTVEMPRKNILYAKGPVGFFPSSPGIRLREHQSMTTTTSINYVTGSQSVVKGSPHSMLRKIHGLMNMFGWGIIIIIGAIVARHMRQTTAYFYGYLLYYSHILIQTTGFLLGLIGIICGLFLEKQTNASNVSTHKALGITILVMGVLQVLALRARPDKESKYRKYWNWYHHNVGRAMIILTISNIFYGIHLGQAGTSWNVGYGSAVGVLALAAIGFEVRNFLKNTKFFDFPA